MIRIPYRYSRMIPLWLAATLVIVSLTACGGQIPVTGGTQTVTGMEIAATTAPVETVVQGTQLIEPTQVLQTEPSQTVPPQAETNDINCTSPVEASPSMTEGPYYTANSPEDALLYEDGMEGTRLVVTGYVLTTQCEPVAGAWLDFWQADANGVYDNSGYRLRGHQFTDENGRYRLETVVPGEYPGRTPHIHVKVQAPDGPMITTQLFIPGVSQNATDRIFDDRLLLEMQDAGDHIEATYNFIVSSP